MKGDVDTTKWRVKLHRGSPSKLYKFAVLKPTDPKDRGGWVQYDSLHPTIDAAIAHAEKRAAGCRCDVKSAAMGMHLISCLAWAKMLSGER